MKILTCALVLLVPCVAFSQAPRVATITGASYSGDASRAPASSTATIAAATRISVAPVLDGKTDDAAWKTAQVIDKFLEYEPKPGADTRFRTEVRVVHDEKHLYVMARMFDPAPDSIISLLSRRDVRTNSEQLKLVIDSYHDRRTAYQFITNPAGVKRDFYVSNDTNEDASWDAVWDVATAIDSLGWTAEFRIPFSQLRFANRAEHTFGLMIVRDVARTGERISWPLLRKDRQGYVSQAGDLGGISGLGSPSRLEIVPYLVTKNETRPSGSSYRHPQSFAAGTDVKYGLSSNLTLNATINPDFGQVEADPAVLNLSAFEQFFEERRPFFLEGAGIFSFNTNCGDTDSGCTGLFYSRRVGRSPQLSGIYGDETSATNTTILGAGKLTGRLGKGLSVGFLDAITQREFGTQDRTIEPRTNYAVGRLEQDLRDGQTGIGVMLTGVNRALDENTAPFLRSSAYTGGIDFRHRFLDKRFELRAYAAASRVAGSDAAIASTQRDGVHRYQRPDDDIEYDPTRTSLTGNAQRLSVSKFGGGITRFQSVLQRFSPGFETNDVGFQSRADEQMFRNWFSLQYSTPKQFFRQGFFNFNTMQKWTTDGLPLTVGVNTNWHVQFKNQWWGHVGASANDFAETYNDREARGGPAVRKSAQTEFWTGVESDRRNAVSGGLFAGRFGGDGGRSSGWWVNPNTQFRVSSQFSGSVGTRYNHGENDRQWRANFGVAGADTTHYTFARLEQKTLSLNARINYTASPTLSLQFYAEPFVSSGEYSNWRELADARAEDYDDRFKPFTSRGDPGGFTFRQFTSNSVLRWEYMPGSTLFLVWAQGRQMDSDRVNDLSFRRDLTDVFGERPDNTFLVKVSYWFNP
ncbi:MAG: carbohydrate binding family 9 domain-containing protein [Gemmatimonadota bacterium]|nr:carbohydrate binding family 9 domain-containing protein [Gemmatimonadota bacterium]